MSDMRLSRARGFTIVELLIVIIVIAILAAITAVAYNGVRERAESAKVISQAKAYIKALKMYELDYGRPTIDSCIVPASATTDTGTSLVCPYVASWGNNEPWDAIFNQRLATYAGITNLQLGIYGTDSPKGLMFFHSNWYSGNHGVLGYRVGPNTDCGLDGIIQAHAGGVVPGATYTARTTTYTSCEIEVFKW